MDTLGFMGGNACISSEDSAPNISETISMALLDGSLILERFSHMIEGFYVMCCSKKVGKRL